MIRTWITTLWRQPMHSGEIVMGIILIGAGSAALVPGHEPDADVYAFLLANGGDNAWAVARLIAGGLLVLSAVHDVVTFRRYRHAIWLRCVALTLGLATFAALSAAFFEAGALSAGGLYLGASLCASWALGSVGATVR